ncbi:MAG: type 4a pilus biogenesis protein PilO [Solirubrobacterales bacterium]
MSSSNRVIIAMVTIVVLAVAFWMMLLSPKRSEVSKLEGEVTQQEQSLAQHRSEVAQGLAAQRAFPNEYQQLVVLGKAAPQDAETASLLVQLNRIARRAQVRFQTFLLSSGSGEAAPVTEEAAPPAGGEGTSSPTEVAASTLPIGATIGPAGLAVMPYTLTFRGSFFHIADFIHGLDSMVKTKNSKVDVTGRLITINGFTLGAEPNKGFPELEASFTVTTFLVPPGEGITGGATTTGPEEATQVSTTIGAAP